MVKILIKSYKSLKACQTFENKRILADSLGIFLESKRIFPMVLGSFFGVNALAISSPEIYQQCLLGFLPYSCSYPASKMT